MSVLPAQQMLKVAGYDPGPLDGVWGLKTASAMSRALSDARAWRSHALGGVIAGEPPRLTQFDIEEASRTLNVPVATVKAVIEVESNGGGFHDDVRREILEIDGPGGFIDGDMPKILFEAHVFSDLTGGQYDATHPNISSPRWNRHLYKGGQAEYGRLWSAMMLDETAALKATSWGLFQILGRNHAVAGYETVQSLVAAMKRSEAHHLTAFCTFLLNNKPPLDGYLRKCDWANFARYYNGPGYAANKYDTRLAAAYAKWSKKG